VKYYLASAGELLLCVAGFAAAVWWWSPETLILDSGRVEFTLKAGTFFVFLQMQERGSGSDAILPLLGSTGMTLVMAALLSYTVGYASLPMQSLFGGSLFAALGILVWRKATEGWHSSGRGIVLVGQGPLGIELAQGLGQQLAGVVSASASHVPAGVAYLGSFDQLGAVIASQQPRSIVIDTPDWQRWISPQLLLQFKLRGGQVETSGALHERVFKRIHPRVFKLTDVLWVETQKANRREMALQAIYGNIIGLLLLVAAAPLLLTVGIASRLQARGRTMFHRVECAGFQAVPFQLRRFHVRHTVTGELTGLGRMIEALGLTGLPQVINLVRGEMGLFGPDPVRMEVASYLDQVCSLYSYRHSARPGVLGWATAQDAGRHEIQEESVLLAYDLYYYEHATPVLDLMIVLRMLERFLRSLGAGGR
jgi:lipopolysaccharide/colanic/teichoic acid biosynthesis glycosyltransferase